MKEIKITDGAVIIKDFCSYKLKKQINKTLLGSADIKSVDGKSEMTGLSFNAIEEANTVALLGMVEKIVINGEDKKPTIEAFDEMNEKDVDKILKEINKITAPEKSPLA
jgi:hypothetical protein